MHAHAYHAKYYAHLLSLRQGANGDEPLTQGLYNAGVDLNPHQIEAALFAMGSPLSKGVLLADEVGLGKTIEAGLVLCQYWAEQRRKMLVICPASLRKQWAMELQEKFALPCLVLDAKVMREWERQGKNPWVDDSIKIISYHYVNKVKDSIRYAQWELVVIDEAHKLRNAYRESNQIGQGIRFATQGCRKILLTATPLQNSLDELYGLSTLIDEHLFGDIKAFRSQYSHADGDLVALKERLNSFCWRTLREQVREYIQYTQRIPITRPFKPSNNEQRLYDEVTAFLSRKSSYAIPQQQRNLTELIVRKLLASSSIAIADTLETMRTRLVALKEQRHSMNAIFSKGSYESILLAAQLEDEAEDWLDEWETDNEGHENTPQPIHYAQLDEEINELLRLASLAKNIGIDSKTHELKTALEVGFEQMAAVETVHKPARKALIFTESRRTQQYLFDYLNSHGFAGEVVLFSGHNHSPEHQAIYQKWLKAHQATGKISGSRDIDIRTALVEYFRDQATIMIATEAAAEGVNMQFCSLVVNYDLPWNPQRIEQRIGRCHRYGQKHDVVVVNFLNTRNQADKRVLELLTEKFRLFDGVFGTSDEVLGTIESGVDFEKRILTIYQQCRTTEQIKKAFIALQKEMEKNIDARMQKTHQTLLTHFDADVHERLKIQMKNTQAALDKMGQRFWQLTQWVLGDKAQFNAGDLSFKLHDSPIFNTQAGIYHLISKNKSSITGDTDNQYGNYLYRLSHPLGEYVLQQAKTGATPPAKLIFDLDNNILKISAVEALQGKQGVLMLSKLTLNSKVDQEEHLLFTGICTDGTSLSADVCEKLFACTGVNRQNCEIPIKLLERLEQDNAQYQSATLNQSMEKNNLHYQNAAEKITQWAQDNQKAAEGALAATRNKISIAEREARQAQTLEEKKHIQLSISKLERLLYQQRKEAFDVEDKIKYERDCLIESIEAQLKQTMHSEVLFCIEWQVMGCR